MSRIDL
jgi:hypothetical protein